MKIQEYVTLAPLTTLHVGGQARFLAEARHEEEVREAVDFAKTGSLPLFILGGGSNIVVADTGFPGLVLHIAIGGLTSEPSGKSVLYSAGAGLDWDDFVAQSVTQNCAGVECLSGIPGTVGGTPVQNVGAYGQEVADTIESVRAYDTKGDRSLVLPRPACGFRYRSSIFNTTERNRYIILRVNYRLHRGAAASIRYADLQRHFADAKTPPSLPAVREAVREIRGSKGMLIVTGDENSRSAGSFFKNPVLTEEQFQKLSSRARSRGLEIPTYPAPDAHRKVSAAWLVEHSGFTKGFRQGQAGLSTKHALAIVNRGDATTSDIINLRDIIQQTVENTWGLPLDPEPVFVGF